MGRHASFEPFRKKINGVEYGNYLCYNPLTKSNYDLGTTDPSEAARAASDLATSRQSAQSDSQQYSVSTESNQRISQETQPSTTPVTEVNPLDALNNFLSQSNGNDIPGPVVSTVTPQSSVPSGTTQTGMESRPNMGRAALVNIPNARKAKGLTPEQAEKISQALSKGAAKINLMIDEVLISLVGRKINDDLEFDDTDISFLKLGWEMQMEQCFQKANPEPWHLIVAGNIFVVLTLLKNSESRKKANANEQTGT
jgi:hypothetical protein